MIMKNGEHVIDVEAMLHGAETPLTDECCIYRVPFHIRKLNEDAYTPDVVSIGPFHHNTLPRLRSMQRALLQILWWKLVKRRRVSEVSFDDISIRHFTDLLRTFHLQHPPERRPPRIHEFVKHLPSVTELSEVGVKFEVNNESKCLLDFTFSEGVLRIPQLEMYDPTEMLFRNMMALEQCYYPYECYITDYVEMMDFLVNTSRDVDILIQKEVLINSLGDSNSVANLFNGLFKNIFLPNASSSYQLLAKHLKDFHRNRWNNLKSTLKHDYCKTPWQTAATIATVVLLILTLVQTLCSVLQLKQQ
ncbi:hypothetical protein Fmac_000742 [Flemingia macrophylla]|uniref:Uncharacterized protein n=1 Tax=Flemingia macrophylla TaxID=520843 RepID=A0ABD1NGE0_9FABA